MNSTFDNDMFKSWLQVSPVHLALASYAAAHSISLWQARQGYIKGGVYGHKFFKTEMETLPSSVLDAKVPWLPPFAVDTKWDHTLKGFGYTFIKSECFSTGTGECIAHDVPNTAKKSSGTDWAPPSVAIIDYDPVAVDFALASKEANGNKHPLPFWMYDAGGGENPTPSKKLLRALARFGRSHKQTTEWAWNEFALNTFFPSGFPKNTAGLFTVKSFNVLGASVPDGIGDWHELGPTLALRGCTYDKTAAHPASGTTDDWPCLKCGGGAPSGVTVSGTKQEVSKGRQVVLVAKEDCSVVIPSGFKTVLF